MSMPTLYDYDNDGYYIVGSARVAKPDPLDPNRPIIPRNSTTVAPPEIPEGQRAKFNTETKTWSLEDLPDATKVTTARIEITNFTTEVKTSFPDAVMSCAQDLEAEGVEKTILFGNVPSSAANLTTLGDLITAHNFTESKRDRVRDESDRRIAACNATVIRHRDQLKLVEEELLGSTTLTNTQYVAWLSYRQDLFSFVATCDPLNPSWPTEPT